MIPYGADPAPAIAARLKEKFSDRLPDLTSAVVLVPDPGCITGLRRSLLTKFSKLGHDALLGPTITTLQDWVGQCIPDPQPVADQYTSELILVEALQGHAKVFGDQDPWRVADSLLPLFEELTLNQVPIPAKTQSFEEQLQQAYGIAELPPAGLGREADTVHRLWLAWQEQLQAEGVMDAASAYLFKLRNIFSHLADDTQVVLVNGLQPTTAELSLMRQLLDANRLDLILEGTPGATGIHPDSPVTALLEQLGLIPTEVPDTEPYGVVLHAVYPSEQESLRARAQNIRQLFPDSPAEKRLSVFTADNAEEEVRGIELQVRRWLLEGIQPIAVVTDDRKLARRLRALLERADIPLQDLCGWALSTTSAAAVVERWLETIEEDFDHQPLLDLLKSSFLSTDAERDEHLLAVYRFEQDLILHENISRGMERYRQHLRYRRNRLKEWPHPIGLRVENLLDRLETAAAPLQAVRSGIHSATSLLDAFRSSLELLGLWSNLQDDLAGQQLLQQWETLHRAAQQRPIEMNWLDFRTWVGRSLETHYFTPTRQTSPVQLLTLEQSRLNQYGGIIAAACDHEHLPGYGTPTPFFNNRVRAELGLPTWSHRLQYRLHDFRALLESAPQILMTWRQHEDGETRLPSPWLEAIRSFHALAYDNDLENHELHSLLRLPESQVHNRETATLPQASGYPAPVLPPSLLPAELSAGAHQRLIDCPYQFFASTGLGLKPPEEVKELLEKSDYGSRVHLCLQAFHSDVPKLPGPLTQLITTENHQQAIDLLLEISGKVFAQDLEDNFMHRGWLRAWQKLIPLYIDWQMQRQQEWQLAATELTQRKKLETSHELIGRLDRTDTHGSLYAIVDYKTGGIPKQEAVDSGEAVQLPTYALLSEKPVTRVEYLQLGQDKLNDRVHLQGDQLQDLQQATETRLNKLLKAVMEGAPMPAWGDELTCRYCEMDGLCRRDAWLMPANKQD